MCNCVVRLKKMLLLRVLLTLGLSSHCALSVSVNNHPASVGEFAYHVSIQNIDSSYHHCGGVIVDPYYVLTAAHCIDGFNPEDFQIVGGTIDLSKDDKIIHEAAELIPHEDYNQSDSWKNDIGLIKVTEPFQFNNLINSAILPDASSDVSPGTKATVIGFGRTNPIGFTSKVLQEADVTVRTIKECNVAYEKAKMHFTDKQICAQSSDGAGICKGDSGGAFIVSGLVAGISSFTNDDCDHRKYPSVFTKVSEYRIWIDKKIKLKSKL